MKYLLALLVAFSSLAHSIDLPVRVNAVDSKAVEATWIPPTTRENGAVLPIDEIGGYELAISFNGGATEITAIAGGSTVSYKTEVLTAGSYEFALRTVDTNGLLSEWTPVVRHEVVGQSAPTPPRLKIIERIAVFIKSIFGGWS